MDRVGLGLRERQWPASSIGEGWPAWRKPGYSLGDTHLALAGRLSSPLRQKEALEGAFGIDLTPWNDVPVRILLERRFVLQDHARSAWAAYIAAGFWNDRLPAHLVADGYGQAGVVGLHRRDLFADGAIRVFRPQTLSSDLALDIGGGIWGAEQPGAARLDIGPHLGLCFPVKKAHAGISLDGRIRIGGNAMPGSGATLTLGTDF